MTTAAAPAPAPVRFTVGFVSTAPRVVLRLEAAAVLIAACVAFHSLSGRWGLFAALFLVPDLSMLGYLLNPRVGAIGYDAGHSYLGPAALAAVGVVAGLPAVLPFACIWIAHIGFDRMLGYGLKYGTGFGHTHLGPVGREARVG